MINKYIVLSLGLLLLPAISKSQTLVGDYQFQGNLSSSVAGAPDLTAVGTTPTFTTGTTTNANVLGLASFGNGSGSTGSSISSGFTLDTSSILSGEFQQNYTIAFLYYNSTEAGGATGWSPSLIYGGANNGAGLYTIGNSSSAAYAPRNGGNAIGTGGAPEGQYNTLVVTANDDSTVNPSMDFYINGTLVFSADVANADSHANTDPATDWDLSTYGANAGLLSFFAADNSDKDYSPSGEVARIEVYQGGMTSSQVSALDLTNESSSPVPEPRTWAAILCGAGMLVGFQRLRRTRSIA